MKKIELSAYDLAQRYIGTKEVAGKVDNPAIMAMLSLDQNWPSADEVPWCSAFVNWIAWHLRLPRSKSLRARSWLMVGTPVLIPMVVDVGFDVVILRRGNSLAGPDVLDAPGHVGFFAGYDGPDTIQILGGNQGDQVSVRPFLRSAILGIRRLYG